MRRARLGALALALALALASCSPVAQFARDLLDTSDGATLTYVQGLGDLALPGLRFDPAGAALDTVLVATGTNLALLKAPDGGTCEADDDARRIRCDLGTLNEAGRRVLDQPVTVHMSGRSVLASVSYRREGVDMPRITYARDP